MIFVGDIALPHRNAIDFSGFPNEFYTKTWFGNLEGAIVARDDNSVIGIYNQKDAFKELIEKFYFKAVALANNHIFDIGSLDKTFDFLNDYKIPHCGAGKSLEEACIPLVLEENGQEIIILNFGWEVIQCEITKGDYPGVNPLRKYHVLATVKKALADYPKAKVIPFMHWNYEREGEPQPFERELAKKLIDIGVAGVIGCHSHRIGGFEFYKNKPIVYSLGNWLFKQNHYNKGKSKFPEFCNQQLAFEWNFQTDKMKFHFFNYNKNQSSIDFLYSENSNSPTMEKYTPFRDLNDQMYKKWYKRNHYHKNKGLPVYYWDDPTWLITIKNSLVSYRAKALKLIFNKGK